MTHKQLFTAIQINDSTEDSNTGDFYLGFGDNEPVLSRKPVKQTPSLNLDFEEIAKIKADREEMLIKYFPTAAKQWGLIK